jgi:glucosamine-6-phosphate deaminase
MAQDMLAAIIQAQQQQHAATLIVPVGPVDQFPILADLINRERVDCREVMLINMDEYLTADDQWIAPDHPLSFRGFMQRSFYDRLEGHLAPRDENRVFPHPDRCDEVAEIISQRGGVDVCFGGIGINGHIAFNEPPQRDEPCSVDSFAALTTRVLSLTCETRTINSVTVGGEISLVPARAVTVGMAEILAARRLSLYCNRPWQQAVVRRALHGPVTANCPASLLRQHANASLTVADFVAQPPDIHLR